MIIAFQGERGAYSEEAVLKYVGRQVQTLPCKTFEAVFDSIQDGQAEFGVLPLENSIGGTIHGNYDLLVERNIKIVGEVEHYINHCLIALPNVKLGKIKCVYSHWQAIAQCQKYLKKLGVKVEATYDTAGSARLIKEQSMIQTAAIASKSAARIYGLSILKEAIQDYGDNITRFAIIGSESPVQSDKMTLTFTLPNKPGSLEKALHIFGSKQINLTKIESRPIRGKPWQYRFYLDLVTNGSEFKEALAELKKLTRWVKVLGHYKSWRR